MISKIRELEQEAADIKRRIDEAKEERDKYRGAMARVDDPATVAAWGGHARVWDDIVTALKAEHDLKKEEVKKARERGWEERLSGSPPT